MAKVLITGGAGFIGSHTACLLLEQGHELVVLDSFANSSPEALRRLVAQVAAMAAMAAHGCRTLVFSGSATVYGHPEQVPISQTTPLQPINPCGHVKAAVEWMLSDLAASATDGTGGPIER